MIKGLRFHGSAVLLPAALLMLSASGFAQKSEATKKLDGYLSDIGAAQFEHRAQTVAAIHTREEAERRQAEVRKKILNLIGGLPESHGPVRVKEFGSVPGDGFRIDKVAYESLPNFWVTADVYVPASGMGPFPALVVTPGHGPTGKLGEANWGANFARAGIITLAIDAIGEGERLQHYDPELEESKVVRSGEHEHAGLATLLIGKHVSRYFINDGMRGVDYLTQRKDVDSARIGAFGCSGGGTITAYLGALDPRIGVTATACYITSLKELLPSTGAQDAEQTIPGFLEQGLDLADWVELTAPRPYAIISTTSDMFPFAGARQTYEEAKRIYALYGAEDRLQWITGPGGHGNLGPISPQILAFLVKYLKADSHGSNFTPYRPQHPDDLLVTPTGQVSTSLGGETVESINRKEAEGVIVREQPVQSEAALAPFQQRVRAEARSVAGITAQPGAPPDVTVQKKEERDGYHVETLSIRSELGFDVAALSVIPDKPGPKPAVLLMDDVPMERTAATPDVERLAKSGKFILILQPRGTPLDAQRLQAAQGSVLGPNTAISLQAMIVGKSLVGMRADDAIRAVNWLVSLPDVDRSSITIYGRAAEGIVALHAAALDPQITRVIVANALVSYHAALEAPLHRNLSDIILPGVLLHFDTGDLLQAIAPRPVVLANPVDAIGVQARDELVHKELAPVFESDRERGTPQRVEIIHRGFRDPLPID
ncbi:MAG TPA: acetylxylan esterase [Bryobacteraceae bacterium]|nr:acetylxylan esterase [Bryobacteraceae bacterium]